MLCWNRSWAVLRDSTATLSEHCQTLATNNVIPPTAATSRQFESVCVGSLKDSISRITSSHFRLVKDSDFSSERYHVCTQNIMKNYWHPVQEGLPADPILRTATGVHWIPWTSGKSIFAAAHTHTHILDICFNPLNPELNPICYLLALLGAHHFLHVSRIRVKLLTFRLLMSYIWSTHSWCF